MSIFESLSLALKNIMSSKMRSFLTMLGIIIGVSAVFVIAGLGAGMKRYMRMSMADMVSNAIEVNIFDNRFGGKSVDFDDMYEIVEKNRGSLAAVSPEGRVSAALRLGDETSYSTNISGVSEDYAKVKDYKIKSGRNLNYIDMSKRLKVCVLGAYPAEKYFDNKAVGEQVLINGEGYKIVGIFEKEVKNEEMRQGAQDDFVIIPYTVAARMENSGPVNNYQILPTDGSDPKAVQQLVNDELKAIFGEDSEGRSFYVYSMQEMMAEMDQVTNVVVAVLTVIAAISLLVGGIGIMNIMLVSVTERTREIGIRKALGAKERYIMNQFVIEASVTSGLGGVIGILFGYIMSGIAGAIIKSMADSEISVIPEMHSVLIAFGISVGIGIIFGWLPARKAARLNPIDALHYD